MKKNTIELWVGVFVVLGLLSVVFLALRVANITSVGGASGYYSVYANFSNIGGLKINAPVKVAGVIVGRVENISLNDKYEAHVILKLEDKYRFSTDSSAQILTSGILGEQYVSLTSGAEEDYLADGDEIELVNSAFILEELIGKLMTGFLEKSARTDANTSGIASE